jgi:L-iditol 2-dehydrogenase
VCPLKESDSQAIPDTSSIPDTMRALVLDGVGFDRLRIARVPMPQPGPRQMLARVDAAGICTSLIGWSSRTSPSLPVRLGHRPIR